MKNDTASNSRESALRKCEDLFEHFDVRARRHKRRFSRYKNLSVALTCAMTAITALQALQPLPGLIYGAPIVSALAAFCTAMVHATNSHELWLRARSMTHQLESERFLFQQNAGIYDKPESDATHLFSVRLMEIWERGHTDWEKAVEGQNVA